MPVPCSIVGFGAVGKLLYKVVRDRGLPVERPRVFARTARAVDFDGERVELRPLEEDSFRGGGVVLFAGSEGVGNVSELWGPKAVEQGCVVIDNSSTFRMDPDVPLVVPEVNADALGPDTKLVANPNCSTIQMVVAIAPIHRAVGIKRIVVATYQSTSGAGQRAMEVLVEEAQAALAGNPHRLADSPFAARIAFNCVPLIGDVDAATGYTGEEKKMANETRKILGDQSIRVSATTVRVGVEIGHAECVNLELGGPLTPEEARSILRSAPGVIVMDDPERPTEVPTPIMSAGRDEVFVGRIREDTSVEHGLDLWIVADNLRKGAATNAVQIAEEMIARGHVSS